MRKIYYAKPSITEKEIAFVMDAIQSGWGEQCYAYLDDFEQRLCRYAHTEHAIATSSATGALTLGLAALGIGHGDEVILADMNWIASAAPIVHCGATPVFVDIVPSTLCLDPVAVERAITPRTKAIIAVHLYGNLCDMDALEAIAKEHSLALIEDAAEALGSGWDAYGPAGCRGTFGYFSFHGTKTCTAGEGGALVTQDAQLAARVRALNNHGRQPHDKQFCPSLLGFKFKMSNLQAALACAQFERIPELVAQRKHIFQCYAQQLSDVGTLINCEPQGTYNGYWMPTIIFQEGGRELRDHLLETFPKHSIDARTIFSPLSSLAMFPPCPQNTVAYALGQCGLNLPSYHDMTDDDIAYVVEIVRTAYHSFMG